MDGKFKIKILAGNTHAHACII